MKNSFGKIWTNSSKEPSQDIIPDEEKVAEMFNNFFDNIVPNLKILTNHNCNIDFQKTDNPVLKTKKQKTKKKQSVLLWLKVKLRQKLYILLHHYNIKIFLEKLKIWMFRRHHNKAIFQLKYWSTRANIFRVILMKI